MPVSESKRLAQSARKRRAAKALVQNTPIEVIAQAEGVSAKTISRDLRGHEVRLVLVDLCTRHEEELKKLFAKALAVTREAMDATIPDGKDKKGKDILIPDWPARLRGVREADHLLRTVTIGRLFEPEKDNSGNEGLEWEQFVIMRARRMATPPARS